MTSHDLAAGPRTSRFELEDLRTFVAGVELGSFARAARRLGRSPSAISTRLRKLTEVAGAPLLARAGRGLALTGAGELLLGYARRLLELEEQAALALRDAELSGWVRMGLQEDFADLLLSGVLGRFARAHPRVRVEARVGRNAELLDRISGGRLDVALVWGDAAGAPRAERLAELAMRWIGAAGAPAPGDALPLVLLDGACVFRDRALAALDGAGRPWRLACTSPSLSGSWCATAAGLGLTVRTGLGVPAPLRALTPGELGLPALPTLSLALVRGGESASPAATRLAELVRDAVEGALRPRAALAGRRARGGGAATAQRRPEPGALAPRRSPAHARRRNRASTRFSPRS